MVRWLWTLKLWERDVGFCQGNANQRRVRKVDPTRSDPMEFSTYLNTLMLNPRSGDPELASVEAQRLLAYRPSSRLFANNSPTTSHAASIAKAGSGKCFGVFAVCHGSRVETGANAQAANRLHAMNYANLLKRVPLNEAEMWMLLVPP